jgi:hypothetical protein
MDSVAAGASLGANGLRQCVLAAIVFAAGAACATSEVQAGERHFTFTYEAPTHPAGSIEYEQWVTASVEKDNDRDFWSLDFRHEIEFGITDQWQIAFYVDWRYREGMTVDDGAEFRDIAFETIYNILDPAVEPIGLSVYGEIKAGPELIEIEGKVIVQKNLEGWIIAYNLTLEAEWEGDDLDEKKGKIEQTAGVAYLLSPSWSIGAELKHEVEYEDWSHWGDDAVYAGPALTYRQGRWFVAVTQLFQLTDVAGETNYQTRLIIGVDF